MVKTAFAALSFFSVHIPLVILSYLEGGILLLFPPIPGKQVLR